MADDGLLYICLSAVVILVCVWAIAVRLLSGDDNRDVGDPVNGDELIDIDGPEMPARQYPLLPPPAGWQSSRIQQRPPMPSGARSIEPDLEKPLMPPRSSSRIQQRPPMPSGARPKEPDSEEPLTPSPSPSRSSSRTRPRPSIPAGSQPKEPDPQNQPVSSEDEKPEVILPLPSIDLDIFIRDQKARAHSLYQLLNESFSMDELRELCFEMDIDPDSLPGEGKRASARELVTYCRRHGRLDELSRLFVAKRPHLAGRLAG